MKRLKEGDKIFLVVFLLVKETYQLPLQQCKNNLEVTSGLVQIAVGN